MTGRDQMRFGHERNPRYLENEGLPLSETLLPAYLAKAGYATGWIGKWHLGDAPQFRPENRGFQETFGFLGGFHNYLGYEKWTDMKSESTAPMCRNGKPVEVRGGNLLAPLESRVGVALVVGEDNEDVRLLFLRERYSVCGEEYRSDDLFHREGLSVNN